MNKKYGSTKKWKNHTPKLTFFKQFFYRRRRVVVNPPYHLTAVITLVIYFGADRWDGPTSLHEMMQLEDETLKLLVDDYRIKLITPAQLKAEDFEKFHTNLRQVLEFIKYSKDKKSMAELMRSEAYRSIDETAVSVIEHCTHLKLKQHIKNEKGEINMCEAWDEMKQDCKTEGRTERSTEIAKNMLQDHHLTYDKIAEYSGLPLDTVQALERQLQMECTV